MPSTSRTRGAGGGPGGPARTPLIAPMSERQQMALVMQMTSQEKPPPPPTPAEERKKSRQQRNERGETPLHVAAIKGDHEQVKKLLDQGQDPNMPDFAGWTALHEACSYGWDQVVEVLVEGGANVNAKGLDDDTPLHDASTSGNLKMVKFLIEHGADPFLKNTKGKIPSDYAAAHIYNYLQSLKDSNARTSNIGKARDDNSKKCSASTSADNKRSSMEGLGQGEQFEAKDTALGTDTSVTTETNDDGQSQSTAPIPSSSQDESTNVGTKRPFFESETTDLEAGDDESSKKKKRKEAEAEKEHHAVKPVAAARTTAGRVMTGTKPPGPASKTGATPLGKNSGGQTVTKTNNSATTNKNIVQNQNKVTSSTSGLTKPTQSLPGKSTVSKGANLNTQSKVDRKSPVPSPKPSQGKDTVEVEEEGKAQESTAPKVPPLKIVIPGGACGSGARLGEQEGEGAGGQRGGGKGRNSSSTLPYVLPCTSSDAGQASDSSDGNSDDKKPLGDGKSAAQRVLRSHRTTDEKDKDRTSPQAGASGNVITQPVTPTSNKSPPPAIQPAESEQPPPPVTTMASSSKSDTVQTPSVELHPRKRKIKASKDSHTREPVKNDPLLDSNIQAHNMNANPYQMYIHIKKQIDRRQKGLFPVKPKPPKDFNKYLMNRCTYTLQGNVSEPNIEPPSGLPPPMRDEYISQEKERHRLRIQHLVEKEKLVLAVEQEILRVHGRAERAVANQSLPYSVCTVLRDKEVYNVFAPEQEEKRNAQRSRCNGRQINSWLQEVDDKWEKIKEGTLRRQHTEAETLHAVQTMGWEWKLKEVGLCDYKSTPKIEPSHVPQVHVSNFDLPA